MGKLNAIITTEKNNEGKIRATKSYVDTYIERLAIIKVRRNTKATA